MFLFVLVAGGEREGGGIAEVDEAGGAVDGEHVAGVGLGVPGCFVGSLRVAGNSGGVEPGGVAGQQDFAVRRGDFVEGEGAIEFGRAGEGCVEQQVVSAVAIAEGVEAGTLAEDAGGGCAGDGGAACGDADVAGALEEARDL